jgi:hypothetical protein
MQIASGVYSQYLIIGIVGSRNEGTEWIEKNKGIYLI